MCMVAMVAFPVIWGCNTERLDLKDRVPRNAGVTRSWGRAASRALAASPESRALASDAAVDVLAKDPERGTAVRLTCLPWLPPAGSQWSAAFALQVRTDGLSRDWAGTKSHARAEGVETIQGRPTTPG